ncbi:UNVERIFIED_CONTAM: hypothetical protein K2H54_012811 [Gekko kuhli]
MRGNRGLSVQVAVASQNKASQWEEGVEAEPGREEAERKPRLDQGPLLPSREKSSGINSNVSSIDSQDRGGQGTEHPQTPGAPAGGSSAPESRCHQEDGMLVAFRPVRHIVIFLPTCQPEEEDPGSRDASVQVGVTCEDKATQWEEREEADPSLDKPSGANSTASYSARTDFRQKGPLLGSTFSLQQNPPPKRPKGPGGEEGQRANDPGYWLPISPDNPPEGPSPTCSSASAMSLASLSIRDHNPAQPQSEKGKGGNVGTCLRGWVSSIDRQDRGGQGTEHPQTPGVPEEGGSSAPESGCHQDDGASVAFRPVWHIIIFLPTCQPEDPGSRDASVQVGVTCEDKATQWEEREEADPSLDKPSGANSTEAGMSGAFPSMHCRRIVVYLPTCLPEEDPGTRDASVQVGVTCEDKATQWEENVQADPSLDKSLGAFSKGMGKTTSSGTATGTARRIVIYLPTCQPEEEDPGSRDASVQVGVTCEDKATQ